MAACMNLPVKISSSPCRTMFHVKPFPKDLPITIATYKDTDRDQPLQLSKVNCTVPGMCVLKLSLHTSTSFPHPLHSHIIPIHCSNPAHTYTPPLHTHTHTHAHTHAHTRTHTRTHTLTHSHRSKVDEALTKSSHIQNILS